MDVIREPSIMLRLSSDHLKTARFPIHYVFLADLLFRSLVCYNVNQNTEYTFIHLHNTRPEVTLGLLKVFILGCYLVVSAECYYYVVL